MSTEFRWLIGSAYRPLPIRCTKCGAIQNGDGVPVRHCYRCGGKCK